MSKTDITHGRILLIADYAFIHHMSTVQWTNYSDHRMRIYTIRKAVQWPNYTDRRLRIYTIRVNGTKNVLIYGVKTLV